MDAAQSTDESVAAGVAVAVRPPGAVETWPLTAAIARGDEAAFARFYDAWFARVCRLLRSFTRRDDAFCRDVAQDVLVAVARSIRGLRSEAAVEAWMANTAVRKALDQLRGEQRRRRRERDAAVGEHDGAAEVLGAVLDREQQQWLRERLAELSADDRRLLDARYGDGETLAACGAALGISGHAAHGRIWRVVQRLRAAAQEVF